MVVSVLVCARVGVNTGRLYVSRTEKNSIRQLSDEALDRARLYKKESLLFKCVWIYFAISVVLRDQSLHNSGADVFLVAHVWSRRAKSSICFRFFSRIVCLDSRLHKPSAPDMWGSDALEWSEAALPCFIISSGQQRRSTVASVRRAPDRRRCQRMLRDVGR